MLTTYYNRLAPFYKHLFLDWNAGVARQATVLDDVIREFFGASARRVLDAACGIGTQSLGLAQLGYEVAASDISEMEIEHAKAEAAQRGLAITFGVADMRRLRERYYQPARREEISARRLLFSQNAVGERVCLGNFCFHISPR